MRHLFKAQMDALVESKVEPLLLETMNGMRETEVATEQALTYGLPVVVQFGGVSREKLGAGIDIRVC